MRVTMLVANDLVHDERVRKTAATVASAGHRVRVLGVAVHGSERAASEVDGFELRLVPLTDPPRERLLGAKEALTGAKAALAASKVELKAASRQARRLRKRSRSPKRTVDGLRLRLEVRRRRRAFERLTAERERFRAALQEERERYAAEKQRTGRLGRYASTWLPELLAQPAPDVIHVHDFHGLEAAFRAVGHWRRRGARVRVVYDAHEYLAGREAAKGNGGLAIVDMEARWGPQADEIVAASAPIAAELHRSWDLPRVPEVIYNLPAGLNGSSRPVRGLRSAVGIDGALPLVVYAGVSNERRGIDVVVRAVALLAEVYLVLVVPAKDNSHTQQLLQLARDVGIGDRVRVAPFAPLDQVVPYLAEADVGAFTPREDGVSHVVMPNKLFEYLHAGLGILTADLGEIGGFVRSTGTGETHRPGDPEDCARALSRLLDDPARYRERREELVAQWSWEAQEPRLLAVYERLAALPTAPALR